MKFLIGVLAAAFWLTAAPIMAQEVTEPITIGDETYYGVRVIPGFNVTGKYLYESKGEPSVTLNADGSGEFARHGRRIFYLEIESQFGGKSFSLC